MKSKLSTLSWLVVAAVGAFVIALVLGLNLFGRLHSADHLLGGLSPAFTAQRVAGDQAAINELSAVVDTLDPLMTRQGGASGEVGKLVGFVSDKTGLPQAAVVKLLQSNFPKTTSLLMALPLSAVSAEIPKLVGFLSKNLHMAPDKVVATLQQNFPKLAQVIVNLPKTSSGWYNVPGTDGLTRFDGSQVTTVPQARTYFAKDVIPVLANQRTNFDLLAAHGGVGYLSPLLIFIGVIALVFGLVMAVVGATANWDAYLVSVGWGIVVLVGVLVLVLIFSLSLPTRLPGGQQVLDAARPAFTHKRIVGDVAAINMVDTVAKTFDPVVTRSGGAAAEVPKLVAFLAANLHLSKGQVLGALHKNFPKTLALLTALPLSDVNAEIQGSGGKPGLVKFLAGVLKVPPSAVVAALKKSFPHIYQAVANLPAVVNGWNDVPGTEHLTRFDGSPVKTVPDVVAYFKGDVIPAVAGQAANFKTVDTTWPRLTVFPPLLLAIATIVVVFGLLMLVLAHWLSGNQPGRRLAAA